jgi:hypothetical protein
MSHNRSSLKNIASRPYSHSLNSYSALFPEELEWDRWGDELFVFNDHRETPAQQPESKTNVTMLTISTVFLILVTATWAKASPKYSEFHSTNENSTTEFL